MPSTPDRSFISAEQMKQVLEVTRALAVVTELDPLLERIAQACCAMLACERSSIFLHDAKTSQLWTKIALGSKEIRVPEHAGIVGSVFKSNTILHSPKPYEDSRFNPEPDRRSGFITRNILAAPMVDLDHHPLGVIQAINKRAGGFSESDHTLIQLLADQAGVAVQRYRLQQAAIEGVALRREMDLAKIVQDSLIPDEPPEIAGIESVGWTKSASITGGDCYDLWRTTDGRLGMFLGDASGHGIAPALVVSQARTLVRALCELIPDPNELLSCINVRLTEDMEAGRFVTAFIGFLDPSGELRWTSAAHGPILIRRSAGAQVEALEPPAPPLGIMPEFFCAPVDPVHIEPGGGLLVASDGILESFDPTREQFGVERVIDILRARPDASPADALEQIRKSIVQWQRHDEPTDDQTIIAARRIS